MKFVNKLASEELIVQDNDVSIIKFMWTIHAQFCILKNFVHLLKI